jgi:hypothetical protein
VSDKCLGISRADRKILSSRDLSRCSSIVKDQLRWGAAGFMVLRLDHCRLMGLWMARLDVTLLWSSVLQTTSGARPSLFRPPQSNLSCGGAVSIIRVTLTGADLSVLSTASGFSGAV